MIHSMLYSLTAIGVCLLALAGWLPGPGWILAGLAVSVALIGLPHGGLDLRDGSHWLLTKRIGGVTSQLAARIVFFLGYLLIAAGVVAGWMLLPTLAVLAFFVLSAWHFGLEEEPAPAGSVRADRHSTLSHLGIAIRGGMVIWVPAWFAPLEMAELLQVILPAAETASSLAFWLVGWFGTLMPLFLLGLIGDLARTSFKLPASAFAVHGLRVATTFFLLASAPLLLGFGMYFCVWHSWRGLEHLRQENGKSWYRLVQQIWPMSILAILLLLCGFAWESMRVGLSDAAVRVIFMGLSAVAIPHLLLHVVLDLTSATMPTGPATASLPTGESDLPDSRQEVAACR